jgi:hypothetical protein
MGKQTVPGLTAAVSKASRLIFSRRRFTSSVGAESFACTHPKKTADDEGRRRQFEDDAKKGTSRQGVLLLADPIRSTRMLFGQMGAPTK